MYNVYPDRGQPEEGCKGYVYPVQRLRYLASIRFRSISARMLRASHTQKQKEEGLQRGVGIPWPRPISYTYPPIHSPHLPFNPSPT